MKWYIPLFSVGFTFVVVCADNAFHGKDSFSAFDIGAIVGAFAGGYFLYALIRIFNELKIPYVPKDE